MNFARNFHFESREISQIANFWNTTQNNTRHKKWSKKYVHITTTNAQGSHRTGLPPLPSHCTYIFSWQRVSTLFNVSKIIFLQIFSQRSLCVSLSLALSFKCRIISDVCVIISLALRWIYLFSFRLSMPSRRPSFIFFLFTFLGIDNKIVFFALFFCFYL
jgi:hypothetical protein